MPYAARLLCNFLKTLHGAAAAATITNKQTTTTAFSSHRSPFERRPGSALLLEGSESEREEERKPEEYICHFEARFALTHLLLSTVIESFSPKTSRSNNSFSSSVMLKLGSKLKLGPKLELEPQTEPKPRVKMRTRTQTPIRIREPKLKLKLVFAGSSIQLWQDFGRFEPGGCEKEGSAHGLTFRANVNLFPLFSAHHFGSARFLFFSPRFDSANFDNITLPAVSPQ